MPKYIIKMQGEIEIEAPSIMQANTIWQHTLKQKLNMVGLGITSIIVNKATGTRHCASIQFGRFSFGKITKASNSGLDRRPTDPVGTPSAYCAPGDNRPLP